uniref:Uncharacterized protein n=1 Tax=Rhizophora mucronata TaxID=61149 RepID=A0A2P2QJV1_RHIMU
MVLEVIPHQHIFSPWTVGLPCLLLSATPFSFAFDGCCFNNYGILIL